MVKVVRELAVNYAPAMAGFDFNGKHKLPHICVCACMCACVCV